MDKRRVRYLAFLVILIVCAQFVEFYALADLAGDRIALAPAEWGQLMVGFLPCIGPLFAFAFFGFFIFRPLNWALWCLVACASLYALFAQWGLLVEYGMSREALAAAARGSRYMNCGGHPRLFFLLFAMPYTLGTFMICAIVAAIETSVRSWLDHSKVDRVA